MLRQCVITDTSSGIVSDAKFYANEVIGDPRYPLDLLLWLITVSLETMQIVRELPTPSFGEIQGLFSFPGGSID